MKGKMIVFEGIDGVGKATQVKLLAERARANGKTVTVFTSPRYDLPTGDLVRRALNGEFGDFVALSPYLSALPYFVDFSAWRSEVISALEQGDVICDRYVYSTLAYASAKLDGIEQKSFLDQMSTIVFDQLQLPKADCVALLDVPVPVSQELMAQKKKDQFEMNTVYQERVAKVYGELSKEDGWHVVACAPEGVMRSREDIHEEIAKLTRVIA